MKPIIISSMIVGLLGLTTINSAFSKEKNSTIYQNIIENKADNSKTISLCEGKDDKDLKPIKQYTIKYMSENKPIEKVTYKWDDKNRQWVKSDKYEYIYSEAGTLESIIHSQWNEHEGSWLVDNNFDILMLDVDQELLTANNN